MTRELLNKVAKAKKINLSQYDSVIGWVNENFTKVYVVFGNAEVLPGSKKIYNRKEVVLSVSAILKREQEWPEDYETSSWTYIDQIR